MLRTEPLGLELKGHEMITKSALTAHIQCNKNVRY